MQAATHLINNCIGLLRQAVDLIERIDDEVYAAKTPISARCSVGGHLRHILDCYLNFLAGIETGQIDYNLRKRDSLIARNRTFAIERIESTIDRLSGLSLPNEGATLLVTTEEDGSSPPLVCRSSVLRELDFLQSHTIHHYSLVAILLRLQEIDPGEGFGVAPSTRNYWSREAQCAR